MIRNKKVAISPVLAVSFEKFFYDQMQNYLDKLKMIEWNSLDTTCKNEVFLTRWISFTGPFDINVTSLLGVINYVLNI